MSIIIKNTEQINLMRIAGKITAGALDAMEKAIRPGITTAELNAVCVDYFRVKGAVASFLNYEGAFGAGPYPGSACISVNEEVIHGLPTSRKLQNGDIVSVDVGAFIGGYHGDAARTFAVGAISAADQKLIDVTRQCFFEGIKFAKAGHHLYEISAAIEAYVEGNGFSVVTDYVGHGVGKNLHEAPEVPNFKPRGRGAKLEQGMVLAIEPMVNAGGPDVYVLDDLWTVVTEDGSKSAHYENTVLITDGEPELLTVL